MCRLYVANAYYYIISWRNCTQQSTYRVAIFARARIALQVENVVASQSVALRIEFHLMADQICNVAMQ